LETQGAQVSSHGGHPFPGRQTAAFFAAAIPNICCKVETQFPPYRAEVFVRCVWAFAKIVRRGDEGFEEFVQE